MQRSICGVIGHTYFELEQTPSSINYTTIPDNENAEKILRRYLGLNEEYAMPTDAHFLKVYEKCGGIRLLKQDAIETLFAFICSQNNHISRISQMVEHLSTYGRVIHTDENDNTWHAFPSIDKLADISVDTLRSKKFGYRSKYIVASAKLIAERGGEEWVEAAAAKDYNECLADIVSLVGVGRKVADCILSPGLIIALSEMREKMRLERTTVL